MENDFETIQKHIREEEEIKKQKRLKLFRIILDKTKNFVLFLAMLVIIFLIAKIAGATEYEMVILDGSIPLYNSYYKIKTGSNGSICVALNGYSIYYKHAQADDFTKKTFTSISNVCDISDNAQYIVSRGHQTLTSTKYLSYSVDGGSVWLTRDVYDTSTFGLSDVDISDNGTYSRATKVKYGVYSGNYLTSWSNYNKNANNHYSYTSKCIDNGTCIETADYSAYGTNLTAVSGLWLGSGTSYSKILGNTNVRYADISRNGQYMCAIGLNSTGGNDNKIYFSIDGLTISNDYFTNNNFYQQCAVSDKGYMYLFDDTNSNYNVVKLDLNNPEKTPIEILKSPNDKKIISFAISEFPQGDLYYFGEENGFLYKYLDPAEDLQINFSDTGIELIFDDKPRVDNISYSFNTSTTTIQWSSDDILTNYSDKLEWPYSNALFLNTDNPYYDDLESINAEVRLLGTAKGLGIKLYKYDDPSNELSKQLKFSEFDNTKVYGYCADYTGKLDCHDEITLNGLFYPNSKYFQQNTNFYNKYILELYDLNTMELNEKSLILIYKVNNSTYATILAKIEEDTENRIIENEESSKWYNRLFIHVQTLGQIFPISIFVKINELWQMSATANLPTKLDALDIVDEEGNVKIELNGNWIGDTKNYEITLWGTDIFYQNEQWKNGFLFFREMSKYATWMLFILSIYFWARKVYKEFDE